MKMMIAIVLATALLGGIFGAGTWAEGDMISMVGTIFVAAIMGAIVGVIIAAVTWIIQKLFGLNSP